MADKTRQTALPKSVLTARQTLTRVGTYQDENGEECRIVATVRHDDECGNGHNSFCITGDMYSKRGRWVGGGRCDDDIAQAFPELAPFQKWNNVSTDGPMHYLSNTTYLAGDKDHNGLRAGEERVTVWGLAVVFGDNPIQHWPGARFDRGEFVRWLAEVGPGCGFDFEVITMHPESDKDRSMLSPKYTFGGYPGCTRWHQAPFDSEREALQFLRALQTCSPRFEKYPAHTITGEGKEPDLEGARSVAVWPDATLAQLRDKRALMARLPALMAEFKRDVESLGLTY